MGVNRKSPRHKGRPGFPFAAVTRNRGADEGEASVARKPAWVVEKERRRKAASAETVWLFGLHAVRDALANPAREKLRLVATKNAADRLAEGIAAAGIVPEPADPRKFHAPLDPGSVHQGAALEVRPLDWGRLEDVALAEGAPRLVLLDRVSDPHNVGAILRSAEVFGARAVVAPARHSAPETGALAKTASGALERQPYLRVPNLGNAIGTLKEMGYLVVGLDGAAQVEIGEAGRQAAGRPAALVLGAEGPGLRARTRALCDLLARIPAAGGFGSLNVSNAAAVALYAMTRD
jgi:23S rRNA (guanosine2251-2'-O)-methyltransferase